MRANLTIILRAAPESSLSLPRPVPRPPSSWSTVEEESSQPSYQDVMEVRFESRTVDRKMSPLETVSDIEPSYEPSEPKYEPQPRRPNIFTKNI